MPEAKTSHNYQSLSNIATRDFSTKPSRLSEEQDSHSFVVKDDKGCREFTLVGEVYSIGRKENSDIHLFPHFSNFVSRRHATLVRRSRDDGSYYYRIVDGDLQGNLSVNGILINGRKLKAHDLEDQDDIIFGPEVSATYYRNRGNDKKSELPDPEKSELPDPEFDDITIVHPGMLGEAEK
ncbi:FHA domain-containing protein [Lyngbya aestuarii]|uniref:FHA domain-containing protein n=1 Tax=Lyngbya aestuarii TaxID=118322 RepID=UPI00403D9D1A